jgi:hypothetical protein
MEFLYNELKVEIFKYILTPISLILLNRNWYSISQDSHTRAEWLIYKYGRAHAMFHAIRLGNNFVTVDVVQALVLRGAIISRYFVQRLVMRFGTCDNVNGNVSKRNPWASDLTLPVFTKVITEAIRELKGDFSVKGNDMELFQYLTTQISRSPQNLYERFRSIDDLILNKKFIPFPYPPKINQYPPVDDYLLLDGYESKNQIELISSAILFRPELVILWKRIGYKEVCSDFNELIIKGILFIYFPLFPPSKWSCPSSCVVAEGLQEFIRLGFQLTDEIIDESIKLFELRMNIIGESLLNSFCQIRGNNIPAVVNTMLTKIRTKSRKKS